MAVPGTWTVFFDWGCDGSPGQFTATFNSGGTWSGSGFSGTWVQVSGMLMFNFASGPAIYSGNTAGGSMTGMMTTFTGSNGCWWALSQSTAKALAAAETPTAADGSPRK
jgi:hypothetical protein